MNDRTLFIIKPDAFDEKERITSEISKHLEILKVEEFRFTIDLLSAFYKEDYQKTHFHALTEYMLEDRCEAGLLRGCAAIERLVELTGRNSDPKYCLPQTIRFRYGKGQQMTKSGIYIVKNAIHRPLTEEEFLYELSLLQNIGVLLG
ncbi:nucleoside-diphosphate kinase [Candidatus Woesearchaeota archaeon]|nr:nucleoside-diphosphate kinase [Candidatus Woesearchaeota archaeon]